MDTLRFSKLLQDKGQFSAIQAETLVEAFSAFGTDNLATKADLSELRAELKDEIASLRTELKGDNAALRIELKGEIATLRAELLKWIIGAIGVQTLVIIGLVLSLGRGLVR